MQDLSKDFKIYEQPRDRLTELLSRRPRHKLYHVLRDISFSVENGRSLGIIGDNGAGKSTLLKLLVGTLQPTSGHIAIEGQVAALLELGAGFHPEFTGRKNIYLNASLLGVPDDNIPELEMDIIEFSELDYFIDRPVKTYSSGMFVRLAFSIATMVRPDILVIDEALSVGDMAFQKKCVERMNRFREEQKTMVFCSHSMYHVQQLCDTAIWIDKGQIREMGPSEEIVGRYEDYCNNKKAYNSIIEDLPDAERSGKTEVAEDKRRDSRILSVTVESTDGEELTRVMPLSDVRLRMEVEILKDGVEGNFGFAFMRTTDDVIASWLTTDIAEITKGPFNKGDRFEISLLVRRLAMRSGDFYVLGGIADRSGLLWYETRISKPLSVATSKGVGQLAMECDWTVVSRN
ncbi:MAG: polysaccharide ABC transporter ATP-binding protein [Gammaproteobacteria bacterium]|nr:ATP-binding cassette domain-containing protein [Pseudomonadales bacterium]MCP5347803.1 ATP-binding cassette domain-containing protein [Pseudomonadales bacterium]